MSWSAKQYVAFEDERTRPVRDLLSALPDIEARSAMDLGCGPGNSTEVLAVCFPDAVVRGLDSSSDMIEAARRRLPRVQFEIGGIEEWNDPGPFDKGSGLRPFLEPLDTASRAAYLERYTAAVALAYPALSGGSVLLPFPRLFVTAIR